MKLKDLLPYIKITPENPLIVIDRNGQHVSVDNPVTLHNFIPQVADKDILTGHGIGTFRFGQYDEQDFLAVKLDFNKEEVEV